MNKNNILISYHHLREQEIKDNLAKDIQKLNFILNLTENPTLNIKDKSIITEDIKDTNLKPKQIYKIIREDYLKETDITIVLLGQHTKCRKFIDKEIQSSLTRYGSFNRRKKANALIILLTDDFIEIATNNNILKNDDYRALITPKNAGQRIYENCINGYAVVDIVKNIVINPTKLIKLIDQSLLNVTNKQPNKDIPFMINNLEDCSKPNTIIITSNSDNATPLYNIKKYWQLSKEETWTKTDMIMINNLNNSEKENKIGTSNIHL